MHLKNPNDARYDPVGGLRKQIKRPRSRRNRQILPIFWVNWGPNRGLMGVYPKGKVAWGPMYLKNLNYAGYDPVRASESWCREAVKTRKF